MSYAICIVPVAPMRSLHDHRAEMSSQVIFGEQVKIISTTDDGWALLECCNDGYTGCCRMNQFLIIENPIELKNEYCNEWVQPIYLNDEKLMVPLGADLSILKNSLQDVKLKYDGKVLIATQQKFTEENVIKLSEPYLNTAYLWGGRTVFGIDCSGFAQAVFKMMNIALPRDANQQVNEGEGIGFLPEVKTGDLAFFDDEDGKIIHVGILLNSQQIIHASGNVRIDNIDSEGIINTGTGRRTHKLRVIKRIKEY
ncbi:MAG: hydrolase Nlp/P60 [Sphingobacteriales bacterium]|nr:MAG: hydrolase Nlp/P60 [Sphingobacteriales bacterium]